MALHVDTILTITELPRDCVEDCSAQGSVDAAVAAWRERLAFTVDRDNAIRCLKGYGAWELDELNALDDNALAEKVLWLACGDFSEYLVEAAENGYDPWINEKPYFEPRCGSDIFCLE